MPNYALNIVRKSRCVLGNAIMNKVTDFNIQFFHI